MKTSYKALTQSRVAIKLEHRSTSWLRFLIRSLKSPTDNREERGWLRRIKKEAIVVLADERKLLLLLLNSFSTQLRSYFKGHFYYANEASCSHQVHKFWNQLGEREEEFKVSKASSSSSEKLWVFFKFVWPNSILLWSSSSVLLLPVYCSVTSQSLCKTRNLPLEPGQQ